MEPFNQNHSLTTNKDRKLKKPTVDETESLEDILAKQDLFDKKEYNPENDNYDDSKETMTEEEYLKGDLFYNRNAYAENLKKEASVENDDPNKIVTIRLDEVTAKQTAASDYTIGKYSLHTSNGEIGYFLNYARQSNFYLVLNQWVKTIRDGEPLSYYLGDVIIEDGTIIKIDRLTASTLDDPPAFKRYIGNLCGPKAIIMGNPAEIVKAIKMFNKDCEKFEEHEFGYNDSLDTYFTNDLRITALEMIEKNTPIKYSEHWGSNKLGFNHVPFNQAEEIRETIINNLLPWDDPKIIFNALAFAVYPLIYPFLKHANPNKFFMMFKGPSGSGKSQMSKWIQSFYGDFQTLVAWTSTDTAINVIGSAFKDAIFAIDDLKVQNFRSENDIKKAMGTLQNYSDSTGRQRFNVDLKLRDERIIKGHMLINAEDLVVTESSTLARGIIISVNSKDVNRSGLVEIDKASKKFSSITPYFIQYILKNYNKKTVEEIFERSHSFISNHPLINDPNVSQDNLPRMINNFAALKTSWQIFSNFLFGTKLSMEKKSYLDTFDRNLISLILDNIERISTYKSEVVFENDLWELLENGTFNLKEVLHSGSYGASLNSSSKCIGYYSGGRNNLTLVIQISTALREMKRMIPNFAISEDTLKIKLMNDNKIKVNPSKKVSLNGRKISGVQWVGDIPKSIFGYMEADDPISQAADILSNSEPDRSSPFKKKEVVEDIYF